MLRLQLIKYGMVKNSVQYGIRHTILNLSQKVRTEIYVRNYVL